MYTFVSYLTYAVAAVVISAFLFIAVLLFLLIDTGIQRLTAASRRLTFQAIHSDRAEQGLRALKDSVHSLAERPGLRTLDHAIHVLAEQSVFRSTRHNRAAEHTH